VSAARSEDGDDEQRRGGLLEDTAALVAMLALWITVGFGAYELGKSDRSTNPTQVTTAAGIEFALPPELADAPTPTGVLEALAITPLRAYSPAGDFSQGSVVVGYSSGTGPTLLGAPARLAADSAPRVEEVGGNIAVRVAGTVAAAGMPNRVTVYSVPATDGDAVVLCLAPRDGAGASLQTDCERVATKLEIASTASIGYPVLIGQLVADSHSLLDTVSSYEKEASGLRLRLKQARFSGEERSLTAQLASLYGRAGKALASSKRDPLVLPAQHLLYTGIVHARAGYALLARAAASLASQAWTQGRSQVAGAERIIASALRRIVTE
jgi:hypothetical protein